MARYQVIPRTLIFLFHEGKVLLLKGAPDKKNFANLYNGLGGHVERGETLSASARRELWEESGLSVPALHLCGILIDGTNPDVGIEVHIFKGVLEGEPPVLSASVEGVPGWFSRAELAGLELVPDVPRYIDRVWRWQPGDPLFYALVDWTQRDDALVRFE